MKDDDLQDILKDLENLQDRLKKYLEDQGTNPQPYTPWVPAEPVDPTPPYVGKTEHCPKCGIELSPVMGYYCPQIDCPTGLGGPSCISNTTETTGKPLC